MKKKHVILERIYFCNIDRRNLTHKIQKVMYAFQSNKKPDVWGVDHAVKLTFVTRKIVIRHLTYSPTLQYLYHVVV